MVSISKDPSLHESSTALFLLHVYVEICGLHMGPVRNRHDPVEMVAFQCEHVV